MKRSQKLRALQNGRFEVRFGRRRRPFVLSYSPPESPFPFLACLAAALVAAATWTAAPARAQGEVSVTLASAQATAVAARPIVLTATVSAPQTLSSGTVRFTDDGSTIPGCSARLLGAGRHQADVLCQAALATGTARLAAVYVPSPGGRASSATSAPVSVDVASAPARAAVSVVSPVVLGAPTALSAVVSVPAGSSPSVPAAGSVSFLDDGTVIPGCTRRPVVRSAAGCTLAQSTSGDHEITAEYSGDTHFSSAVSTPVTQVAEAVAGYVSATLNWAFRFAPAGTRVLRLTLQAVPAGAVAAVSCQGTGCPVSSVRWTLTPPAGGCDGTSCAATLNLSSVFAGAQLGAGDRLGVTVLRNGYVSKTYSFLIRAERGPQVTISCLTPGASRSGLGCRPPSGSSSAAATQAPATGGVSSGAGGAAP